MVDKCPGESEQASSFSPQPYCARSFSRGESAKYDESWLYTVWCYVCRAEGIYVWHAWHARFVQHLNLWCPNKANAIIIFTMDKNAGHLFSRHFITLSMITLLNQLHNLPWRWIKIATFARKIGEHFVSQQGNNTFWGHFYHVRNAGHLLSRRGTTLITHDKATQSTTLRHQFTLKCHLFLATFPIKLTLYICIYLI